MKTAILQLADAAPLESTAIMLRAAGYDVVLPNDRLRALLREIGCDTVLSPKDLTRGMGYDPVHFPEVGPESMETCDLYGDVKAHRAYRRIVKRWPRLKGKVLWTRINGARPEHVVNARGDHGDEINPPCPVLTPNMWYAEKGPWQSRSYACWPPFQRFGEYFDRLGRKQPRRNDGYGEPVCLIHNLEGWGYGRLLDDFRHSLGVRCYGAGSPEGLVSHSKVPSILSNALAMVHLKSNDAPGYALYEALATACPVVCTRRLIWRCKMQDLLIPGKTCLAFDRETHDALTDSDVISCSMEVADHLEKLRGQAFNERIGLAGYNRLKEIMWSEEKDGASFRAFMEKNFHG